MKHDTERGPEGVVAEHIKAQSEKTETRIEAKASSQPPPNETLWFPKPDHLVSSGSG
jgi:hypothetical protein